MNDIIYSSFINTPVGNLELKATANALTAIRFVESSEERSTSEADENAILNRTKQQLREYFEGNRKDFNLSIQLSGTPFENDVWDTVQNIPWGATVTYSQLAKQLGDANKVRAVGRANGQNALPIVIPCHRVIGARDKLTGYAGGIERKRWLLKHEGAILL